MTINNWIMCFALRDFQHAQCKAQHVFSCLGLKDVLLKGLFCRIPRSQSHFSKECLIVCYLLWWCCHGEVFGRAEGRPHVALVWLGWFGLWGWHDLIDGRLGNTTKSWDDSNSLGSFFERKYRRSFPGSENNNIHLFGPPCFWRRACFSTHSIFKYFQVFAIPS